MAPNPEQLTISRPPPGLDKSRSVAPPGFECGGTRGRTVSREDNRRRLIMWELIALSIVSTVFFALEGKKVPVLAGLGLLMVVVIARHALDAWLVLTVRAAGGDGWHERSLPLDEHPRAQLALFVLLFIALWAVVISNLFTWLS